MKKITPLRRENYALETEGKRRCETCRFIFRLNAENFPRRGRGRLGYDCRVCRNAAQRVAYAADPEMRARNRATSRRNYYAHREERLQQQREYVAKHRKRINARKRAHYHRNRQRLLEDRKVYRLEHHAVELERMRQYHQRRKAAKFARMLDGVEP